MLLHSDSKVEQRWRSIHVVERSDQSRLVDQGQTADILPREHVWTVAVQRYDLGRLARRCNPGGVYVVFCRFCEGQLSKSMVIAARRWMHPLRRAWPRLEDRLVFLAIFLARERGDLQAGGDAWAEL